MPAAETPAAAPPALPRRCENCGVPLYGEHCHACGQPTKGLVRHFSSVLGDFFDTVFNIDSRVLRTIGPLLTRPGFLSLEYFAGRRVRYVTPMRLFLFLSLIAFFAIQGSIEINEQGDAIRIDAGGNGFAKPLPEPPADSGPNIQFPVNGKPWDPNANPLALSWLPAPVNATLNRRMSRARDVLKASNSEKPLVDALFNVLPQTLIVLLPLFALMLKLAYWFKRRLYMEHLIVALHSHSFIALALTLLVALSLLQRWLAPAPGFWNGLLGWAMGLAGIWIPVYLLLMQKRVYGQGWPMNLVKYAVLGLCYSVLLSAGLVAAILIGLLTL